MTTPRESAPSLRFAPGDVLAGKYRIKRVLGEGGVGFVLRATHVRLDQDVAIKLLRDAAAPARVVERFSREARAAAQLRGEHAVRILDVEVEGGTPFIVMEYLEGEDLDRVVRERGAMSVERATTLLLQACEGLAEAHALGIVHRDVKPANLFLARTRSGDELVKLLDFGISKALDEDQALITEPERPLGSPAFMSPEQIRAAHDVDARTDVWSLGVAGYFMVSGRLPFAGTSATQVAAQITADAPTPLDDAIAPGFRDVIMKCLEKDPAARPTSIAEVARGLAPFSPDGAAAIDRVDAATAMGTIRRSSGTIDQLPLRSEPATQSLPDGASAFKLAITDSATAAAPSAGAATPTTPAPTTVTTATERVRRVLSRRWLVLAIGLGALVTAIAIYLITHRDRGAPIATAPSAQRCSGVLHVRVLFDQTGPTRDVNLDTAQAILDYLEDLRAHGGLRGCSIEIEVADTKYDVETALAAYRTWRAGPHWASVSTVFGGGTAVIQALGPLAAEDKKVLVSLAYGGVLGTPLPVSRSVEIPSLSSSFVEATLPVAKRSAGFPYVFFPGTDYATSARVAMSFAWKRGAKRVGFFACSTTAFCTDPVDGAKTFLPNLGTRIGRDLAIELDDDEATIERKLDDYFTVELRHAKEDKSYAPVDWIWFGNQRTGLARLGRALQRVRQRMKLDVNIIANNWALDESITEACGSDCTGFFGVQPLPAFGDGTASGMPRLLELHRTRRAAMNDAPTKHTTAAYVAGYVAAQAWRDAVENVVDAGQPVTGDNLRAAYERFRQKSIDGFATLTYSPTDHRPQAAARVYVLGPTGTLDKVGQPLSIELKDDWLGW